MNSALPLSVVVVVRDGAATLDRALAAILASEMPRDGYELIVVDDASIDESTTIAARYADAVVRLGGRQCGPAYARNRGADLARGEVVAFVDADAMVKPPTLPGMLEMLARHPGLDAIAASRDAAPAERNFASQYWNLLVHFGEHRHALSEDSFPSGCAAIRRSVLLEVGMYDEWRFETACLESIELGKRVADAGHGVLLSRDLEFNPLKRWSFLSVCGEVWKRSALLTRSFGYQRARAHAPAEVVLTLCQTAVPAFAFVGTILLCSAFFAEPRRPIAIMVALAGVLIADFPVYRFFLRTRGVLFAIVVAPVHVLMQCLGAFALCIGRLMRDTIGDQVPDAATQAYAEVGLETWPPVRRAN
jgi:glycosyltransferase involved in cell wall biosynthesis